MKLKTFILLLSTATLSCSIFHKKKDYVIPDSIPVEVRGELEESIKRGKILYKENCTGCHGIFTKGKEGVPNFSEQEIHKYSARYVLGDPTNHAVAIQMHSELLQDILNYLRYHAVKNGVKDIPAGI